MSLTINPPKRPVENWEHIRDQWIQNIHTLFSQVETWATKLSWGTLWDRKQITEETLGTYEVPVLLIHTPQGRLILDPIAKNIVGAAGRVDFCVFPSYDGWPIVVQPSGWTIYPTSDRKTSLEFSEANFLKLATDLLTLQ